MFNKSVIAHIIISSTIFILLVFIGIKCSGYETDEYPEIINEKNALQWTPIETPVTYEEDKTEKTKEEIPWAPIEKPVIYLYGYDGQVNVSLEFQKGTGMIYSIPKYNNGWSVWAKPEGTIYDQDGQSYDYLYWEADTAEEFDFSSGFCIKKDNVEEFLKSALVALGLKGNEIKDFIEYWLPQMSDSPYYVISFDTSIYERIAKLNVEPAPDRMIRVFMTWYPTDKPVEDLTLQNIDNISNITRSGKTVIEWGGSKCPPPGNGIKSVKNKADYQEMFKGIEYKSTSTGTHIYTDQNGKSYNFTEDEWNYLISSWSWSNNPEMMVSCQTVDALLGILSVRPDNQ